MTPLISGKGGSALHYSNTLAMLEAQRDQMTIYLEDVMELVQAIFADVRYQTGQLVEDCQIENMERLVANLSTVTGSILYVFRKREQQIMACESRYVATLNKVQSACAGHFDKIKAMDEKIRELEALQQQQQAALAEEESKNAGMVILLERTRQLQEQIDNLLSTDPESESGRLQSTITQQQALLAELEQKFRDARQEAQALEERCQQAKQQLSQQEGLLAQHTQALEQAKHQAESLDAEQLRLQQELEATQRQMDLQREQIADSHQQRLLLEQEGQHLSDSLMEANVALELQRAANTQFRQTHLDSVQQELEETRAQAEADRQQLRQSEQQLEELEEQYKTLNSQLTLMKVTERTTQNMVQQEQSKLDDQRQRVAQLEAQVREKASEHAVLMDREQELQRLVDEKNQTRIREQIAENISKLEQTLEEAQQAEQTLASRTQELEQAQQERDRLCVELENCRSKTLTCREEYRAMMAQYQQLASTENQHRIEQTANRLVLLKKLAGQLTQGTPCGPSFRLEQTAAAELDKAERTLGTLREAIQNYTRCRQEALEGNDI